MKTVYLFYKLTEGFEPVLYAFANDKYIKDEFIKQRNMKMFHMEKIVMDKKEYKSLLYKTDYNGLFLDERKFETYNDKDELSEVAYISLVCTANEEMQVFIQGDKIFDILEKDIAKSEPYAALFKPEISDALCKLLYFDVMKASYRKDGLIDPYYDYLRSDNDFDDNDMPHGWKVDYFQIFLKLFGNTLDIKINMKDEDEEDYG